MHADLPITQAGWPANLPVVAHADGPLAPPIPRPAPVGEPIRSTQPNTCATFICRLNGQWLSREHWDWLIEPQDVIEWYEVPAGGNTLRSVLQIAVAIAAIYYPPLWTASKFWQAAAAVAISVGGNLAINALLPLQGQGQGGDENAGSPTYSTNLSGNQARLYGPIRKVCGAHLIFPDFAAQPYFEFQDNDQYYRALLAVGEGQHTLLRSMIDDTDLNRFADVLVARYLAPGVQPSDVRANVVSAPEVAGAELKSGRYIGGFAANGPRSTANRIGIDIVAPRGLSNLSVQWRVERRAIDDFGSPIESWTTVATETQTANTNTAQRWSYQYTLPAARYEIRLVRLDAKNEDPGVAHEIQWVGLRAYLTQPAPLNPHTAHFEVVLRASEQLSSIAQRRIALLVIGHCRTWDPVTGWSAPAANRNPFWWLADLWSSPTWGEGRPDSRIDLATIRELALQADARQDRFDYVFDSTMDAWEAAQMIARAGRARTFRRGAVYTCARDQLATLPVTAFTARNCLPNSMSSRESLRSSESSDGVIIEYFDNRRWDWVEIEEPLPGVTEVTRPVIIRLPGVTGLQHARREARYEAAAMRYRTRSVSCVTEMQGMLPAYLQPVLWQPDMTGYGATGDVTAYADGDVRLSEPVPAGATQVSLMRDDGSIWGPTAFTVLGPDEIRLSTLPDFTVNATGGRRERTRFLIGAPAAAPLTAELVRVASIGDGGARDGVQYWRIDASIDDARVHSADVALLPGPSEIQDPIDTGATSGGGGGGGGGTIIISINNFDLMVAVVFGSFVLTNTGVMRVDGAGIPFETFAGQWTAAAPLTVAEAEDYEVRVTVLNGSFETGPVGTWVSLGTTREWVPPVPSQVQFLVEIREAASGIVQDSAIMRFTSVDPGSGGGGGGGGDGP